MEDLSSPSGQWYVTADGHRLEVTFDPVGTGYHGVLVNENGGTEPVDDISWNAPNRFLEFRRVGNGFWQWYRGAIAGRGARGRPGGDALGLDAPRFCAPSPGRDPDLHRYRRRPHHHRQLHGQQRGRKDLLLARHPGGSPHLRACGQVTPAARRLAGPNSTPTGPPHDWPTLETDQ